jgi:hypothetical protein
LLTSASNCLVRWPTPQARPSRPAAEAQTAAQAAAASNTLRVFLMLDVACFMLQKFGGPKLLHERIRDLELDVANPDA